MKSKIFITYKHKNAILKSDIITPIQTGRDLADENFECMIGDNTGDNISILNDTFCETSAIYWIWKNYDKIENPDKIGFMHYRRHFLFSGKNYTPDFFGLVKFANLDKEYLQNDLTDDSNIEKVLQEYDIIIPQQINIKTEKCSNNYEQYKENHNIKDYDKAMEIVNNNFAEYANAAKEYNNSFQAYFLNMFVFNKEIFFKYCKFLFGVLFELYNNIDISSEDKYQKRVIGFISERLTGIFITKLKQENYKYKELPVSFIENTKYEEEAVKNDDKTIQIAVSSSDIYVPYLFTFILSILEHSNKNLNYQINILEYDISLINKRIIKEYFKKTNININFITLNDDILNQLKKFDVDCADKHYNNLTYARLFIPQLLPKCKKCLYFDIDIVVEDDVSALYEIELDNNYLAVCRDWIFASITKCLQNGKLQTYAINTLGLNCVDDYFQCGVQILNLEKMRTDNVIDKLLEISKKIKFIFADQCLYNYFYKNNVKYIESSWNYQIIDDERRKLNLINYLKIDRAKELIKARALPRVIHYSGKYKPWFYPDEEFADIWWAYARKTPFYELILKRMMEHVAWGAAGHVDNKATLVKNYRKNCLKYWKYKILRNFVFGKTRQRYITKKAILKSQIRQAKQFKK